MNLNKRISKFLDRYSDHQEEYEYFAFVLDLMKRLDTPLTEGYAWMNVMQWTTFYTKTRVIGGLSSQMGSYDDASEAVAVIFADISSESIFWKAGRPAFRDVSLWQAEKDILSRLREDVLIQKIETYLE